MRRATAYNRAMQTFIFFLTTLALMVGVSVHAQETAEQAPSEVEAMQQRIDALAQARTADRAADKRVIDALRAQVANLTPPVDVKAQRKTRASILEAVCVANGLKFKGITVLVDAKGGIVPMNGAVATVQCEP